MNKKALDKSGVKFHLPKDATYNDFVKILNIFKKHNIGKFSYSPDDDVFFTIYEHIDYSNNDGGLSNDVIEEHYTHPFFSKGYLEYILSTLKTIPKHSHFIILGYILLVFFTVVNYLYKRNKPTK